MPNIEALDSALSSLTAYIVALEDMKMTAEALKLQVDPQIAIINSTINFLHCVSDQIGFALHGK